ncbi:hypothetical protein DFS34DRAFT_88269 [Phlyctochytrium arcticum]|nr:hypothetical protein DFS34DRAFT_88269 [Phlyctochytrium arcticum]
MRLGIWAPLIAALVAVPALGQGTVCCNQLKTVSYAKFKSMTRPGYSQQCVERSAKLIYSAVQSSFQPPQCRR